jgi:hypothetical protein
VEWRFVDDQKKNMDLCFEGKNPVDVTFPVNLRLELVNKSSNDIVEYFVSSSSLPREMLRPPVTLKPNRPSLEECVTRAC